MVASPASRRPLGGERRGGSSLRPALAAFAPWRGCSMRTQSYASQLAAAEAGTSRDGRRSNVDRRRARGSRFFLQKNASAPARWGLSDAGVPPPPRLALFFEGRAAALEKWIMKSCSKRKR